MMPGAVFDFRDGMFERLELFAVTRTVGSILLTVYEVLGVPVW